MKLEDMRVGVLVKCTKPEWDCYDDIFEITKELPDNEWEITRRPYWQRRQSGKGIKNLRTTFVVKQEVLQHNFKIDKVHQQAHISMLPSKAITINIGFDKITTAESMGKKVKVGLYHEDKYDEFVGAVEALAKLYDRKSPFDEIEELKEAARAAEDTVEVTEMSDERSTVEKEEEPKPHSPVDDMENKEEELEEEEPEKTFVIKCYGGNNVLFKIIEGEYITYVDPFNQEGNDEFEKIINNLSTHYDRKSPLEEIQELKDAQKAAVKLLGFEDLAEKLYLPEEDKDRHSPVDDMDLTPPLEVGCLIKLKNPYTDKLKGKWFKVTCIGTCLGYDTAVIPVFLEQNKIALKAFREKDLEVVCERYRNIWDKNLKYQFGDRVVLTQTGFNVKRKSYGTVIDWRQYNNENYYIVHWDDEDARFIEGKEELIPEDYLLPVRYE